MNDNYKSRIKKLQSLIVDADIVLIGAGAGLSTSAGLIYSGDRFHKNFAEHIEKYGISDMYSAGFYPFNTAEEKWSYWSKHIKLNRYDECTSSLYDDLYAIVESKNYFVITTNADGMFFKSGFDKKRIFAVQGDYAKFQCSMSCHNKLYDNKEIIHRMVKEQTSCKIPSYLIPRCKVCGADMEVNIRKDDLFVEDENWDISYRKYEKFISSIDAKKIVFLEFGIGYNTPSIIKYPFERMTMQYKDATLVRFNKEFSQVDEIDKNKSLSFDEDIKKVITDIKLQHK